MILAPFAWNVQVHLNKIKCNPWQQMKLVQLLFSLLHSCLKRPWHLHHLRLFLSLSLALSIGYFFGFVSSSHIQILTPSLRALLHFNVHIANGFLSLLFAPLRFSLYFLDLLYMQGETIDCIFHK